MPSQLKTVNEIRVYDPVDKNGTALFKTEDYFPGGQTVIIDDSAFVMGFEGRPVLALRLIHKKQYLLLDEIDTYTEELAIQWSELYSESVNGPSLYARTTAANALLNLQQEMMMLMRTYIRPQLMVVRDVPFVAIDENGPGKKVTLW